jgi:hypothetical protein
MATKTATVKSEETAKTAETSSEKKERKFEKAQLVKSKKLAQHRYIIDVIFEDGKYYTMEEAEKLIDECIKKEV